MGNDRNKSADSQAQEFEHPEGRDVPETAGETADEAPKGDEGRGAGTSTEELQLTLQDAQAKADEYWNQLLRAKAEITNLQRRAERDLENAHKFGLEKLVRELLPVVDSLELGLSAAQEDNADPEKLREGMELTLKMLSSATGKFGVKPVDPARGEKFNPELHQAMSVQETPDVGPNTVVTVYQKGYTLNDRLIRPAMVVVSGSGGGEPGGNGGGDSGTKIDEMA